MEEMEWWSSEERSVKRFSYVIKSFAYGVGTICHELTQEECRLQEKRAEVKDIGMRTEPVRSLAWGG